MNFSSNNELFVINLASFPGGRNTISVPALSRTVSRYFMRDFKFYKPFDRSDFFYEKCFLCGIDFVTRERTDEHIFPKWLQHKFDLWNKSLLLFNQTKIQYRFLKIPCCKECNGTHLSKMEDKFKKLLERRFENIRTTDELIIFQWTAKILYGTLYKDLSLKLDKSKPDLGEILSPNEMEAYSSLHLLLQSTRINTIFQNPKPWSIFVFNYQDDSFHYFNDIDNLCFSIKLGKIGITIAFEDNNQIESALVALKRIQSFQLSIVQFLEVSCKVFYAKKLGLNTPVYLSHYYEQSNSLTISTLNSINTIIHLERKYRSDSC